MSLLDQLGGAISGLGKTGGGQAQQGIFLQLAMQLLQQHGGVEGLLKLFQQQGIGDLVSSWIGTAGNQGFSADQLLKVFGKEPLRQMAQDHNMSEPDLLCGLSQALPQLVDRLTPDGQAGTGDQLLSQGLSALRGLFG